MKPTEPAVEVLLRRRAADLARPLHDEPAATTDVVLLGVGGRRYAVETRYVRLVVHNRGARRLPASAGALVGLTLVRGEAVPLIDLASVLGVGGVDLRRDLVAVIDGEHPALGLLVDEVVATESLPVEQLRPVVAGPGNAAGLERAVTPHGVVLLDAEVLLSGHRLDPPTRRPFSTAVQHPGEPCET